jgi:hypothetical protein
LKDRAVAPIKIVKEATMSKLIWPSIAVILVALFLFSRRRKIELELEIEPAEKESEKGSPVETALSAE